MHHIIFPSQDTFITNTTEYVNSNFGLDEILRIGAYVKSTTLTSATKSFYYNDVVNNLCVLSFTGLVSGSLNGISSYITGSTTGGTGSINLIGYSGSAILSGSNFSGSLTNFSGSLTNFSGSISTGTIVGNYIVSQSNQIVADQKYIYRSLVEFDISQISKSIASGDIKSPSFTLKLFVAKEENSPLVYNIYAFPLSQSWNMGTGYLSDGGSLDGASWNYTDSTYSIPWTTSGSSWYSNVFASQSFSYQNADINMDVSKIVYSWLSGSIPNNGFILLSDIEYTLNNLDSTLTYFSKDTNTIYQPYLDVGWNDWVFITGSVNTGSVSIITVDSGYQGVITNATITNANVSESINGFANYISNNTSASGIINVTGLTNNISIFGDFSGSISGSILQGNLLDGVFSGSQFTSSVNGYLITSGNITGSWNSQSMIGSNITSQLPFALYPNTYSTMSGDYINGIVFGKFNVANPFNSASFNGIFTTGNFAGSLLNAQLSGTFLTSSYSFTSSVNLVTSSLYPLQLNVPIVTVIQNLPDKVKAGSIIRINVFAREQYPFKNFERKTQFNQFLTPLYLPTGSYYAIKDNETEQIILDFDNYTQISCDTNGNYFLLDTTGLPQERYFRILIKTEQSGSIYTFDNSDIFKITR